MGAATLLPVGVAVGPVLPARRPAVNALQRSEIIAFFVGKDGPRRNRENAGPAKASNHCP